MHLMRFAKPACSSRSVGVLRLLIASTPRAEREGVVDEDSAIAARPRHHPQPVEDVLRGLHTGVEVVTLKDLD